jgi:DNA invertase Pin-like site-specific DNA recombinase
MEPVANGSLIPAAEYVRKSTDHQRYSTENQSDAIRAYAAQNGMMVVRTYSDAGKSGLSINRRTALKQLLNDVQTGQANFRTILVYDVSRWGRFQDVDESGYYEYICKRAGVNVEYCAEQFANDGSPIAAIIKALKRAMAAEYSRELSVKTFAGLSRIVELGFRPGGTAGYGYRRLLVDPNGKAKCVLANGERKSIANERIKLVPGPVQEVETVRWIFSTFVQDRKSEFQIATTLNNQGVPNSAGGRWTHRMVNMLLRNEKYIGNNVWNRTSFKLQTKHLSNSPEMWLRADRAFEAIIDRALFDAAETIFSRRALYTCRGRRRGLSDDEMLEALRQLWSKHGYLTVALIESSNGVPCAALYRLRFGGLKRAYELIGYRPNRWKKGITRTGRPKGLSDDEMLEALRKLRKKCGYLTRDIITTSKSVPSLSAYYMRFGSMTRVYQLIGFTPESARLRARRSPRFASDEALLNGLGRLLQKRGRLSRKIIDEEKDFPARGTLVKRFGSLLKAFELVGYAPDMSQCRLKRLRDMSVARA